MAVVLHEVPVTLRKRGGDRVWAGEYRVYRVQPPSGPRRVESQQTSARIEKQVRGVTSKRRIRRRRARHLARKPSNVAASVDALWEAGRTPREPADNG